MSCAPKANAPAATEALAKNQKPNAQIIQPHAAQRKSWAMLQARAALAGITLHRTTRQDGVKVYIVSRWALSREFPSLETVEEWLCQVTGGRNA